MDHNPLRVASIGIGWWSDVLADAVQRSGKLKIVSCYSRSVDKRTSFAEKYACRTASSYEAVLADPEIEAILKNAREKNYGVRTLIHEVVQSKLFQHK